MDIREHKFFYGCSVKVANQAKAEFEALSRNMDKAAKEKALNRLNAELDVIMGCGYFYEFYLFSYIFRYSLLLRRLISIQGLAAYSYVAFLLGISTVNPVEKGYPMEMMFGYHHDYPPVFSIHTTPSFKPEIIDFLCDAFGRESVMVNDYMVYVKGKDESDDSRNHIFFSVFESEIIAEVERFIFPSNVSGISLNTAMELFNITRLSVLKPVYPSGRMRESEVIIKEHIKDLMAYCIPEDGYSSDAETVERCFDKAWDDTYEGLLNVFAMVYGTGVLEADLRDSDNKRLCTRDDFFKYGLSIFGNEKDALEFMNKIRKGQGDQPKFQDYLDEHGVPEYICDGISKIRYLMSEGSLIPKAQLFLFRSSCIEI